MPKTPEARARQRENFRLRYATDAAFREKYRQMSRDSYARSKEAVGPEAEAKRAVVRERERVRAVERRAAQTPEQRLRSREQSRNRSTEGSKQRSRDYMIKWKYGITSEQYEAMLARQGRRCAICLVDKNDGRGTWHIDHDHVTGVVRGILCNRCNLMLGHALEKPQTLTAAAAYLVSKSA